MVGWQTRRQIGQGQQTRQRGIDSWCGREAHPTGVAERHVPQVWQRGTSHMCGREARPTGVAERHVPQVWQRRDVDRRG
eukprot:366443-Chlamydomonas_euryale.AAC.9